MRLKLSKSVRRAALVCAAGAAIVWAAFGIARWQIAESRAPNPYRAAYSNPYPRQQNEIRFVGVFDPKPGNRLFRRVSFAQKARAFLVDWISPPSLWDNYAAPYPTVVFEMPAGTGGMGKYRASGRASDGSVLFMETHFSFLGKGGTNSRQATFGVVRLPHPGVPDTVEWVDVSLDDMRGHAGTWRIYRLIRLKHALLPDAPPRTSQTVQNIPVSVRAWWDAEAAPPINKTVLLGGDARAFPVVVEARAVVPPKDFTRPSQTWGVRIVDIVPEWADPTPAVLLSNGSMSRVFPAANERAAWVSPGLVRGPVYGKALSAVAPTPSVQHLAQVKAELIKYDTLRETVTFGNVALESDGRGWAIAEPGVSVVTPSGVRVHLERSVSWSGGLTRDGRDVSLHVDVSPGSGLLPASPLQKRVGAELPLRVTWEVLPRKDVGQLFWGRSVEFRNLTLSYPKQLTSPLLDEVTVVVTQEAVLQTVPLDFMVPVQNGKPRQKWGKETEKLK